MIEATDLASWFNEDELDVCPSCGDAKLIPTTGNVIQLRVCLDCGVVGTKTAAA